MQHMHGSRSNTEHCHAITLLTKQLICHMCIALTRRHAANASHAKLSSVSAGEHSTTRLCLQWLFSNRDKVQGAHVMDYGTGSGILAVAALLLGAASAVSYGWHLQ